MTGIPRLEEALVRAKPTEHGGSIASGRLNYQKDWTLCKLLELHSGGAPYLVICDYHEDVLILNRPLQPDALQLCQIKSRREGTRAYNITDVTQRTGGAPKGRSIIGRLAANCHKFAAYATTGVLASSAGFNLPLNRAASSETLESFGFTELSPEAQSRILGAIERDLSLSGLAGVADNLTFVRATLSVADHSTHAKGRLTEFLEALYPGRSYQVGPLYRAIFDEIKKRSDFEGDCGTYEELRRKKGITREEFAGMLVCANTGVDPAAEWEAIRGRLNAEGMTWDRLEQLSAGWRSYEAERMDPTNLAVLELANYASACVARYRARGPVTTLTALVDWVAAGAPKAFFSWSPALEYVQAAVLWEVTHEVSQLPDAGQKPAEEAR